MLLKASLMSSWKTLSKKQIVMRGANNILKGLYENYDAMFSEDSAGGAMLTPDEADAIRKLWEQSNNNLTITY